MTTRLRKKIAPLTFSRLKLIFLVYIHTFDKYLACLIISYPLWTEIEKSANEPIKRRHVWERKWHPHPGKFYLNWLFLWAYTSLASCLTSCLRACLIVMNGNRKIGKPANQMTTRLTKEVVHPFRLLWSTMALLVLVSTSAWSFGS